MTNPTRTAKPDVVTPEQWRAAREALLVKEKAHTRARDAMAAERRRMPMIRVEKGYRFTAPGGGDATLLDRFDGSRQLVVYRFFMDPDMDVCPERGCPGCSMYADQLSNLLHLRERDTRFVAVSRGRAGGSPALSRAHGLGIPLVDEGWPQTPPYTWRLARQIRPHTLTCSPTS